jgi:NTE family protein
MALVFSLADLHWPTPLDYRAKVYPKARQMLTCADLFSIRGIGLSGVLKYNFKILTSRAHILADRLAVLWGVSAKLSDLPDSPTWWINTTCFETGKNWRFTKRHMGDWKFGRHYDPPFSIAEAAAASAAVPYAIGALDFDLPQTGWHRTDPVTRAPLERKLPPNSRVRLWDGGAYENLGLETIYKPERAQQDGSDFVICSDASGPLGPPEKFPLIKLLRGKLVVPRLFDIAADQNRSLRSRMFIQSVGSAPPKGVLLRLGNSIRDLDRKTGKTRVPADYDAFLSDGEVEKALLYATDLAAATPEAFDRIAQNGDEVADATLNAYASMYFPQTFLWPSGRRAPEEKK